MEDPVPNSHPSGYKNDSEVEEKTLCSECFEEDHYNKPAESMVGDLKPEKETEEEEEEKSKAVDEVSLARGVSVLSVEVGADICQQPCDIPLSSQIHRMDGYGVANHLENGKDLINYALFRNSAEDDKVKHIERSSIKILAISDIDTVNAASGGDSELHRTDEATNIDVQLDGSDARGTIATAAFDEAFTYSKPLNLKNFHQGFEKTNAASQKLPENYLLLSTRACPMEAKADEYLSACTDSPQVVYPCERADNYSKKETTEEKFPSLSMPSNTSAGDVSEVKHGLGMFHGSMEPNLQPIYPVVESGKEPEDHQGDATPMEVQPQQLSVKLDETADTTPTLQPSHREAEKGKTIIVLDNNQNVTNRSLSKGSSLCLIECESGEPDLKLEVDGGHRLDRQVADSHVTSNELSRPQAIAFEGPITDSSEKDMEADQLEVEIKFPSKEKATYHDSLHKVMLDYNAETEHGGPVVVADIITQSSGADKIITGSQHVIHKERESNICNADGVSREEVQENSSSGTKGNSETTSALESDDRNTSALTESEYLSDRDVRKIESERNQELLESTSVENVPDSEGTEVHSTQWEKSCPCLDKPDRERALHQSLVDSVVYNDSDFRTKQAEVFIEPLETESIPCKKPNEEPLQQKVQFEQLPKFSGLHILAQLEFQKAPQEGLIKATVNGNTDDPVPKPEIQIEHNEIKSSFSKQPGKEPDLDESSRDDWCHHGAQNFLLRGHKIQNGHTFELLNDNKTISSCQIVLSSICHDVLEEQTNYVVPKQQSDAALVAPDASVNSTIETDGIERSCGLVSDGAVPLRRQVADGSPILNRGALPVAETETPECPQSSDLIQESSGAENNVENSFETSSNVTLAELTDQPASNEIQPMQNPQTPNSSPSQVAVLPSSSHTTHEFEGRKSKVVIFEDAVDSDSEKPHNNSKNHISEVDSKGKEKTEYWQELTSPLMRMVGQEPNVECRTRVLNSKTTCEIISESSSDRTDQVECNSPANHAVRESVKKRAKGKSIWVSFMRCSCIS